MSEKNNLAVVDRARSGVAANSGTSAINTLPCRRLQANGFRGASQLLRKMSSKASRHIAPTFTRGIGYLDLRSEPVQPGGGSPEAGLYFAITSRSGRFTSISMNAIGFSPPFMTSCVTPAGRM